MLIFIVLLQLVIPSHCNPFKTEGSVNGTIEAKYSPEGYLDCIADSNIKTKNITWFRDNKEVSNDDFIKTDPTTNRLYFKELTEKVAGEYKCEVQNEDGGVFSKTVMVNPKKFNINLDLPQPKFKNITVKVGDTGTLIFRAVCLVSSYPRANVTFMLNGNIVKVNKRITIGESDQDGVLSYELVIRNVTYLDAGEYHCRAANGFKSIGILANTIMLKEECSVANHWKCPNQEKCVARSDCRSYRECLLYNCEKPSTPTFSSDKVVSYNSIAVSWEVDHKVKNYLYILDASMETTKHFRSTSNTAIIRDLKNNTAYSLKVYAINEAGMSEYVNVHFRTERMVVPQIIRNLKKNHKIVVGEKPAVYLEWDPPVDDGMKNKKGDLKYDVRYCLYQNGSKHSCQKHVTTGTGMEILHVKRNALYTLSVTPYNEAGQRGPSKHIFFKLPTSGTSIISPSLLVTMLILLLMQFICVIV